MHHRKGGGGCPQRLLRRAIVCTIRNFSVRAALLTSVVAAALVILLADTLAVRYLNVHLHAHTPKAVLPGDQICFRDHKLQPLTVDDVWYGHLRAFEPELWPQISSMLRALTVGTDNEEGLSEDREKRLREVEEGHAHSVGFLSQLERQRQLQLLRPEARGVAQQRQQQPPSRQQDELALLAHERQTQSADNSASELSAAVSAVVSEPLPSQSQSQTFRQPVQPFAVFFVEHSGSSWFTEELHRREGIAVVGFEPLDGWPDATPEVLRQKKFEFLSVAFSPHNQWKNATWFAWRERLGQLWGRTFWNNEESATTHIAKHLTDRKLEHATALGFKLRPYELGLGQHEYLEPTDSIVRYLHLQGTKLIILFRRNAMKQAVSAYRRHFQRLSQFSDKRANATVVNIEDVVGYLSGHEAERAKLLPIAHQLGLPTLELYYEDLLMQPDDEFEKVCKFLGVQNRLVPGLRSRLKKSTPDRLCDAVGNYQELCNFVKRTLPHHVPLLDLNNGCECKPLRPAAVGSSIQSSSQTPASTKKQSQSEPELRRSNVLSPGRIMQREGDMVASVGAVSDGNADDQQEEQPADAQETEQAESPDDVGILQSLPLLRALRKSSSETMRGNGPGGITTSTAVLQLIERERQQQALKPKKRGFFRRGNS